jgi:hypothetical protein
MKLSAAALSILFVTVSQAAATFSMYGVALSDGTIDYVAAPTTNTCQDTLDGKDVAMQVPSGTTPETATVFTISAGLCGAGELDVNPTNQGANANIFLHGANPEHLVATCVAVTGTVVCVGLTYSALYHCQGSIC